MALYSPDDDFKLDFSAFFPSACPSACCADSATAPGSSSGIDLERLRVAAAACISDEEVGASPVVTVLGEREESVLENEVLPMTIPLSGDWLLASPEGKVGGAEAEEVLAVETPLTG